VDAVGGVDVAGAVITGVAKVVDGVLTDVEVVTAEAGAIAVFSPPAASDGPAEGSDKTAMATRIAATQPTARTIGQFLNRRRRSPTPTIVAVDGAFGARCTGSVSNDRGMEDLVDVADVISAAERIVVLTGAGISTNSGIPDFRGPNGVWTKNPAAEKASNIEYYLADPDVRAAAWQARLHNPAWTAKPNSGHAAIVELERRGQLHALITQNIDELHQRAGTSDSKVIEVHGTMWWTRCWSCDDRRPMDQALDRVRAGDPDPPCLVCGGIIKSDTISFGQSLVPEVIDRAFRVSDECDVMLAIGSTLSVFPAANCVPRAKNAGGAVVIVNGEPTAMDPYADRLLIGQIAEILPQIIDPQT
jgi:NAD-dependent deacetylase